MSENPENKQIIGATGERRPFSRAFAFVTDNLEDGGLSLKKGFIQDLPFGRIPAVTR